MHDMILIIFSVKKNYINSPNAFFFLSKSIYAFHKAFGYYVCSFTNLIDCFYFWINYLFFHIMSFVRCRCETLINIEFRSFIITQTKTISYAKSANNKNIPNLLCFSFWFIINLSHFPLCY
jgi:hypothetical protein